MKNHYQTSPDRLKKEREKCKDRLNTVQGKLKQDFEWSLKKLFAPVFHLKDNEPMEFSATLQVTRQQHCLYSTGLAPGPALFLPIYMRDNNEVLIPHFQREILHSNPVEDLRVTFEIMGNKKCFRR